MSSTPSDDDRPAPAAPVTYRDAGVDIEAGNALVRAIAPLVKATRRAGAGSDIGGFGGLFDLKAAGFDDPILVAANDGVGTKLKIAIETGRHRTIGIDLVAMCVNDIVVQGAEPLFFLDYFACSALDIAVATDVIAGIADGCREAGCALIGGETAEMPGMYAAGDYDLAGFSVGAAERGRLLPLSNLEAGDVVIGLASSGVHSNGYSLVRRLVADAGLGWADAAPFAPDRTLAAALLEPTRIYVRPLLAAARATGAIKALAHITGGGLLENIPRVIPDHLSVTLEAESWQAAPVFGWLQNAGALDGAEMARTFNCGIGMVVIASKAEAQAVCEALEREGEKPSVIGRIEVAGPDEGSGQPVSQRVKLTGELRFEAS